MLTLSALLLPAVALFLFGFSPLHAQVSGNQAYRHSQYREYAEQQARSAAPRQPLNFLTDSTFIIAADVLMNVKADQFVTVFGVSQDGKTVEECNREIDRRIEAFLREVGRRGIKEEHMFVDVITQNRIYDYRIEGSVATEHSPGFELKKNVSIRIDKHGQIEELILAAARHEIFDLVKVDYIVNDITGVQNLLLDRASEVIGRKLDRYSKMTGSSARRGAEIYAEDFRTRYPANGYKQYTAFESSSASSSYSAALIIKNSRKARTFYFDSVDMSGFDAVINPVILEPVVQFTLRLAVKYELETKR